MTICFVGLGGNFPETFSVMKEALHRLAQTDGVEELTSSRLYRTTPISDIPQADFLNAVCRFNSTLSPENLLKICCQIEEDLGKKPKMKNAPRLIDLDLLFYGSECIQTPNLTLPHPHWSERFFVLVPLFDLVSFPIDLREIYKDNVSAMQERLPYAAN